MLLFACKFYPCVCSSAISICSSQDAYVSKIRINSTHYVFGFILLGLGSPLFQFNKHISVIGFTIESVLWFFWEVRQIFVIQNTAKFSKHRLAMGSGIWFIF